MFVYLDINYYLSILGTDPINSHSYNTFIPSGLKMENHKGSPYIGFVGRKTIVVLGEKP